MESKKICLGNCYGCTACKNICPKNAISMKENEKGFYVPEVDEDKCINCNLCKKICKEQIDKHKINKVFLLKNKNDFQHLHSQSGGAFSSFSDWILGNNGVVFGVRMNENNEGEFFKASSKEERDLMHGSKYMQVPLNSIFKDIIEEIKNKKVLFVGTPCQVAGLKKYIKTKKINADNLFTIDLICHGTPSVKVWRAVIKNIEKTNGKVKQAIFRDKVQTGWGGSLSSFYCDKKISDKTFCRIFFTDLCLNDSCYTCEYASKERVSDITIGDAWGVKEKNPEFYDTRGVSIVLVNTIKGEEWLSSIRDNIDLLEVPEEKYIQKNMSEPSKPHRNVEEFWNDFNNKSFNFIKKKYGENNVFLNHKYILKKGMNLLCKRK